MKKLSWKFMDLFSASSLNHHRKPAKQTEEEAWALQLQGEAISTVCRYWDQAPDIYAITAIPDWLRRLDHLAVVFFVTRFKDNSRYYTAWGMEVNVPPSPSQAACMGGCWGSLFSRGSRKAAAMSAQLQDGKGVSMQLQPIVDFESLGLGPFSLPPVKVSAEASSTAVSSASSSQGQHSSSSGGGSSGCNPTRSSLLTAAARPAAPRPAATPAAALAAAAVAKAQSVPWYDDEDRTPWLLEERQHAEKVQSGLCRAKQRFGAVMLGQHLRLWEELLLTTNLVLKSVQKGLDLARAGDDDNSELALVAAQMAARNTSAALERMCRSLALRAGLQGQGSASTGSCCGGSVCAEDISALELEGATEAVAVVVVGQGVKGAPRVLPSLRAVLATVGAH